MYCTNDDIHKGAIYLIGDYICDSCKHDLENEKKNYIQKIVIKKQIKKHQKINALNR